MAVNAIVKFLNAARSLVNQGMSKEAVMNFAKNEFGEINELFKKQIDNLFKPKQGIENIKLKDEVFDDTVVKMQFDDSGVPFNPKDPLKTKSLTYEEAIAREKAKAAADEDYIIKVFDPEDFAKGGRAGLYTGGMVDVEPNLSDIGHGSDSLMARTRLVSPGNQATTSTGLNYLLAEDNDNLRVPFSEGNTVEDKIKTMQKDFDNYKKGGGKLSYKKFAAAYIPENFAEGGRTGFANGNGVAAAEAENAKFAKRVRQLMDEGFDMGEAVREAMKEGYAEGGRIGFAKGKLVDAARRSFLKKAGAAGAGIAALKSGIIGLGKEAAPMIQAATETIKQAPSYFFDLANTIKMFGKKSKVQIQDRVDEYFMPSKDGKSELMLTEDVGTGEMQIKKIGKENDEMVSEVQTMEYSPGAAKADESTKGIPADDYQEYTEYNSRIYKDEYNDPDVVDGINVEDITKELIETKTKKASGGIARMLGE